MFSSLFFLSPARTLPYYNKTRKSFTLIELVVVIAIIAILAAIIAPNAFRAIEKAKIARVCEDAKTLKTAAYNMYTDTGFWPGSNWSDDSGHDPLSPADRGEGFVTSPTHGSGASQAQIMWDGPYIDRWFRNPWGGWYWWDYNYLDQNGDGIDSEHVLWIDNGRGNSGRRIPLSSREKIDDKLDDGNLDTGRVQTWQGSHSGGNLGFILIQGY